MRYIFCDKRCIEHDEYKNVSCNKCEGYRSINAIVIITLAVSILVLGILASSFAIGFKTPSKQKEIPYQDKLIHNILLLESTCGKNMHGKSGEYGPAQFKQKTFCWMKRKAGMEFLEWKDDFDQVILLSWAIENGYGHHWTTYRRAVQMTNAGNSEITHSNAK